MKALRIIIPGLLTTVQDGGRTGNAALGFSQCGAMDEDSMREANILVGNDDFDAVLEMTLTGISAEALCNLYVAVTGGAREVFVNGEKFSAYETVSLKKGDYITVGSITEGCRAYLAVRGGIAVPEVSGSRSTFLKIGMGGFEGRKLQTGDELPTEETLPLKNIKNRKITPPKKEETALLRAIPGPQDDMFSAEELDKFFAREYKVLPASDRMGIRLSGDEPVKALNGSDIISDGIVSGSVQIPKNGQPIILCADRQTTGGYAKPVTVISSDMPKCGRLLPGQKVRFEKTDVETAQKIKKEKEKYFTVLKKKMK